MSSCPTTPSYSPASPTGRSSRTPTGSPSGTTGWPHGCGVDTTFHKLRHYSATELILAGVDVRTVAGRLGHGGGGTTTLRTYTAWVSEADQRAATGLGAGMPGRPALTAPADRARTEPRHPYEKVAVAVIERITRSELRPGDPLPLAADLVSTYEVSLSTARRAIVLLKSWGAAVDGKSRPLVARPATPVESPPPDKPMPEPEAAPPTATSGATH